MIDVIYLDLYPITALWAPWAPLETQTEGVKGETKYLLSKKHNTKDIQ